MEGCVVTDLKVHSRGNCYRFSPEQMQSLQSEIAVSIVLEPGTNIVRITEGSFGYGAGADQQGEPLVLFWIYGGKVVNQKTNVEVSATWSSLNGYDDTLTLIVKEPVTLCAFFFDTHLEDNSGEILLSIARI
ncbi:hypothetical protein IFO70_25750 [Phormidium tenue FACHB-886]|nr:hypothetical protein [Phormidium tenue FACHB-886]